MFIKNLLFSSVEATQTLGLNRDNGALEAKVNEPSPSSLFTMQKSSEECPEDIKALMQDFIPLDQESSEKEKKIRFKKLINSPPLEDELFSRCENTMRLEPQKMAHRYHQKIRIPLQQMLVLSSLPGFIKNSIIDASTDDSSCLIIENNTCPIALQPKKEAIEKILEKYKQKYGIEIITCKGAFLKDLLIEWKKEENFNPRGIIIWNDLYGDDPHVTPIIVSKNEDKTQILILDVVGNESGSYSFTSAKAACETLKIPHGVSTEIRQADQFSCRIEATVVLRNAIIALNQENFSDMMNKAPIKRAIFGSECRTIEQLPSTWTYGNQIFSKSRETSLAIPRDIKSKNLQKNEQPKSIREFRELYKNDFILKYTLTININDILKYVFRRQHRINEKELIQSLKSHINCCEVETTKNREVIKIIWKKATSHNSYMLEKTFKHYYEFTPNTQENCVAPSFLNLSYFKNWY